MKTADFFHLRGMSSTAIVFLFFACVLAPLQGAEASEPKPYREIEVLYTNNVDGTRLAGTLTLPNGNARVPALLLITGMGPQDRDETIGPLKPFAVLADYLTRRGLAVLRIDDRGTGKSSGDWLEVDYAAAVADIQCGLKYLKSRREILTNHIGLLGHSEGGGIGAVAAAKFTDVDFLVMMGAVCVPQEEYILWTNEGMLRRANVTGDKLEKDLAGVKAVIAAIRNNPDAAQRRNKLLELVRQKPQSEEETQQEVNMLASRWARDYMAGDVTPSLRALKCSILAMWGEKDVLVGAQPNAASLRNLLKPADEKRVSIKVMPAMNHLFQKCVTGDPEEFFKLKETINPEVLRVIGDWVLSHSN